MSPKSKLTVSVLFLASCATRNSPATQATPKTFDAAGSEPKAVELVDQAFKACGGENWPKAKEVIWSQALVLDGELKDVVKHSWDRWNGRHQQLRIDHAGGVGILMQDLFSAKATGEVTPVGKKVPGMMSHEETDKVLVDANKRFPVDAYQLSMCFKLKDPGVHLKYDGARAELDGGGSTQPSDQKFDAVYVTFDPGVGPTPGDKYRIVFDRETHLIARVEKQPVDKTGDDGWSAFDWKDYTDVKGLKIAMKREEVGSVKPDSKVGPVNVPDVWKKLFPQVADEPNAGAFLIYNDVSWDSDPDDTLYEPDVAGATLQ